MDRFLIILDPGHGIETLGKRSPVWSDGRQLFEHEFNLDIANRIRSMIKDKVFVLLLREDEHDVSLPARVKLANSYGKSFDKTLLISIHANAGGGTGWEVFTSIGETDSDRYATIFFEEMSKQFPEMSFRTDYSDGDPDKEAPFYMLKRTIMPAVLTENFFMDTLNPDCEILMSKEGRQKIAQGHVDAIQRIIKLWENEK
jgi:N-acetylmuramoyl-L-alanine amidase